MGKRRAGYFSAAAGAKHEEISVEVALSFAMMSRCGERLVPVEVSARGQGRRWRPVRHGVALGCSAHGGVDSSSAEQRACCHCCRTTAVV